jgi:hypothetical protein
VLRKLTTGDVYIYVNTANDYDTPCLGALVGHNPVNYSRGNHVHPLRTSVTGTRIARMLIAIPIVVSFDRGPPDK